MDFKVSPNEMLEAFGLEGVVYYPRQTGLCNVIDDRTVEFLSRVGLPDDDLFMTRASVGTDGGSTKLPDRFGPEDGTLPDECRAWLTLGYFCHSLLALSPCDGKIYAFGEGELLSNYTLLHRDIESLAYSLLVFKRYGQLERDGSDRTRKVEEVCAKIKAFDELPLAEEDSQWNMIFDEVLSDMW